MNFNHKIILFTCVIVFNGILTGVIMSNILPDLENVILITTVTAIALCLFSGFVLQYIQATFFDKKMPQSATESLLDFEERREKKLSDNRIWPFKLALIFSFVLMLWLLLFSFGELN